MKKLLDLAPMLASLLAACNVESLSRGDCSAGVGVEPSTETAAGACPDGVTVLLSDFLSTLVTLGRLDGTTLSDSFLSTGSCSTDGLSFALSGDVSLPSTRPRPGQVVLLDRFGTNVISWADAESARVLAQLPVGTGFESNPSDYLELDRNKAMVARWGENNSPGRQAYDGGSDVLLIDPEGREITGSIALPRHDGLPPRPSSLLRFRDQVLVSLERVSLDFASTGEAQLVGVSIATLELDFVLKFAGLKACGRPALSPNGELLAVACTGDIDPRGAPSNLDESALVLLDATQSPPVELRRFSAAALAGGALQNDVEFANDEVVLLKTQTSIEGAENNRWLAFHVDQDRAETLLEAMPDANGKGKGIVYGGMSCAPGCSDVCLLADADRGLLQRVRVDGGNLELLAPVTVERMVGLPPRDLALR